MKNPIDADDTSEQLYGSRAPFAAVFEHAALGIAVVDMEGRPTAVNPALERMLGYSERELQAMAFPDFTHPDDIQADLDLWDALIAGEHESYRIDKRYIRGNGDVLWGRLAVSLIRDAAGVPQFALAMLEDVTELRLAEDALRSSEEQRLAAQRLEAIGQLAGGIAHDFNNLLSVVLGSADLLAAVGAGEAVRAEQVARIRDAVERASALTRQLLAFARRQRFDLQVFRLNDVAEKTLALLRLVIPASIEIELRLDPELSLVRADAGQLEQVIMNLVLNARDAMPDGGVLEITTANVDLLEPLLSTPAVIPPGAYVVLSVSDNGLGMDPVTAGHVFDPFFTTKAEGEGTGLGLSTVFGIVKQSGGFISVDSEPRRGTTFTIHLPQSDAEPTAPARPAPAAVRARTGATILVVDDEPVVRAVLEQSLTALGYVVLTAAGGAEGLETVAREGEIDLVISDLVMPGMSGVEFMARLTARSGAPVRVLYVSGYSEDQYQPEPGAHYLQKPFTTDALVEAVERVLG